MKYLIVSGDQRIPPSIEGTDYELWSKDRFIQAGSSDEGIPSPDDALYYNVDSIDEMIYQVLKEAANVPELTYYRFSDQDITLPFLIEEGIDVYPIEDEVIEDVTEEVEETAEEVVVEEEPIEEKSVDTTIADVPVIENTDVEIDSNKLNTNQLSNILNYDDINDDTHSDRPAKVILFGSSKGGTGKTFTCLLSAYRYAQTHPEEKVALADFDIIDGQIGITIYKSSPTMADYYKQYISGNRDFKYLQNVRVKNDHFSSNLDFYLAPPMDIPEVTNNTEFWKYVFTQLITHYDVVFFDSGIDYLGKKPISRLYEIADKIILTSNTSINSVKSIIRQLQTLSGLRKNNVFEPEMKILDRVNLVLTRVSNNNDTNKVVVENLQKYAPIIAAFGNIDDLISRTQWYQQWEIWDSNKKINEYLDQITSF